MRDSTTEIASVNTILLKGHLRCGLYRFAHRMIFTDVHSRELSAAPKAAKVGSKSYCAQTAGERRTVGRSGRARVLADGRMSGTQNAVDSLPIHCPRSGASEELAVFSGFFVELNGIEPSAS